MGTPQKLSKHSRLTGATTRSIQTFATFWVSPMTGRATPTNHRRCSRSLRGWLPIRPEAFNNLGAASLRAGNPDQAETAFRRSLALRPGAVDALYNLGALLNARGKYSESKPLLEQAYHSDHPGSVAYELAVALRDGRYERGIKDS